MNSNGNGEAVLAVRGVPNKEHEIEILDPWPDPPSQEAYYGLLGEIVKVIEPHTEADPVAVLVQAIAAFGSIIGRSAHFTAEADRHFCNLFCCLVGNTSKGRKGSSWGQTRRVLVGVDDVWLADRQASGLSSGEGLIYAVRDVQSGVDKKGVPFLKDEGVSDKRLLVHESEFASVLKVIQRERNTLSAIIRQAWDTGTLSTLVKNDPTRATDAHISMIGHITKNELKQLITETDMANGLANRFLWVCVRRSKCLPEGGALDEAALAPLTSRLRAAVEYAKTCNELRRSEHARALWCEVYPNLSEGKLGLLGAATSRAEAQVMRLATIYAILDLQNEIGESHLRAALALWRYAEQSAKHIFGSALGDATADDIMQLLKVSPDGASRTGIRDHLNKNKKAHEINRALNVLLEQGMARREIRETQGRPAEIWFNV